MNRRQEITAWVGAALLVWPDVHDVSWWWGFGQILEHLFFPIAVLTSLLVYSLRTREASSEPKPGRAELALLVFLALAIGGKHLGGRLESVQSAADDAKDAAEHASAAVEDLRR
jgi:hypothetical protein